MSAITERRPAAPRMRLPRCACCNKPYGSRWLTEETAKSPDAPPVYQGNGYVVKEYSYFSGWRPGQTTPGRPPGHYVVQWTIWDGESIRTPYRPFCTLRCACAFADAAHEAGFRVKGGAP